jgi:long-subunit fatty acid transport protein
VLLTFGLTFNLGDRFNLGAGVNYRTLQSQSPTPAINAPPASVTLSAGGNF